MKTFEERYTAWIDNKLEGPALTSFELELSRRASAGEARADKEDAGRLHQLLTVHLKAPAMTNAEFFSHQLRERIEAEHASNSRREESRQNAGSFFSWPLVRLIGLGAASLFVVTALYYGMMPPRTVAPAPAIATNAPNVRSEASTVITPPAPESLAPKEPAHSDADSMFAQNSPRPPTVDLSNDIDVKVSPSTDNVKATPLKYKDPNVSVIWINGLDYMPSVPGESPANPAPAPAASAQH